MAGAVAWIGRGFVALVAAGCCLGCTSTPAPSTLPAAEPSGLAVSTSLDIDGTWVGCNADGLCDYNAKVVGRLINLDLKLVPTGSGNALTTEKPGPWFLPPGTYQLTFTSARGGDTGFEPMARCTAPLRATPNTAGFGVSVIFRASTCEISISEAIVD